MVIIGNTHIRGELPEDREEEVRELIEKGKHKEALKLLEEEADS